MMQTLTPQEDSRKRDGWEYGNASVVIRLKSLMNQSGSRWQVGKSMAGWWMTDDKLENPWNGSPGETGREIEFVCTIHDLNSTP
jgi:hypothetical protein